MDQWEPDWEEITRSQKEMKEREQIIRDEHPNLPLQRDPETKGGT